MGVVTRNIERIAPATNKGRRATVEPLQQAIVGNDLRTTSLILAAVVLVVLLLACANVANLILARGVGRRREMAVRAALGGTQGRIVRQLPRARFWALSVDVRASQWRGRFSEFLVRWVSSR